MADNIKATETADGRITLSRADRLAVCNRNQLTQGSWNYERMQNGGFCYAMIPAIKKLYKNKDDQVAALKRHLAFYNTHPYLTAPILGVVLALEEARANGEPVDDETIQGVKVGMMGPLAGVGDPVFWYTVRPLLGALGASLAMGGSVLGPILFFVLWNVIRLAFLWYTQEAGYKAGTDIAKDISGGALGKITEGAAIVGMFVIGALVERWVSITFAPVVSTVQLSDGAYIDWDSISSLASSNGVGAAIQEALTEQASGMSLTATRVTTLQDNLDSLIPGLAAVGLTLLCSYLLKKKVSPIVIILALFGVGILGVVIGLF